jgi:hypothetical protein
LKQHRRTAKAAEYRTAIADLQQKVQDGYRREFIKVTDLVTREASSGTHMRVEQLRRIYDGLKDAVPLSQIPVDTPFAAANEIHSAMLLPLYSREQRARLAFWMSRLGADVLASHIDRGCPAIDIVSVFTFYFLTFPLADRSVVNC